MNELQRMNSAAAQTWTGDLNGGCVQTVGNLQYWPYPTTYPIYHPIYYYYPQIVAPTECIGDVHVFPCAHCGECKCGKAHLAK